ncbi:TonB-linked outer membrane protein, SusC/RagA family [Mucilaginibacter mallensis]|uniref:TonB-linked outer membrane protein, SusC/RagA family n=1 Tax=Mucilaginibacter mallensis TaxID=652787 RepID=A0A1H2CEF0_MUCMA|nr:SusC/RagA family TonB-linked outer membrane protein [Mucilaginibacter mallensis]SDT68632.1 TonB-linked outer membrane protein, SusC/RagA family [Mucilaginibacter mallensis]
MKKLTIYLVRAMLCPKIKKQFTLALPALCVLLIHGNSLLAQQSPQFHIKGSVFSGEDSGILPKATIKNNTDGKQTITNSAGEFQLLTADTSGTFTVSYIGFKPLTLIYNHSHPGPFRITLMADENTLREVTVSTGYQTLPQERADGSFAQVDNKLLNRRVSTDILSRLEGVVPDLLFNRNTINGSAGQVDISIRGQNTLFANSQPLIVVDGFPYDGDLNNINPNDIESITVLKDASAASIWGVRSGNGVIVLTTKKGKQNQPLAIELNANVTIGNKPDLYYSKNYILSSDFIGLEQSLFNRGFYDSALQTGYAAVSPAVQLMAEQRAGLISASDLSNQLNLLGQNDIRKDESEYLYRHSVNQQYNLNLRGGGDKSDYFLSLGDDQDNSFYQGNQTGRITINSRLNFYPVKNLQISVGANYVQSTSVSNNPLTEYGGLSVGSNGLYPYAQLVNANGTPAAIPKDYALSYTDTVGHGKLLDWNYRPLDEFHNADNSTKSIENRIDLGVNYKFFKDFHAELKYQYEHSDLTQLNNYNSNTYYARNLINDYTQINPDGTLSYPIPVGGILQQAENGLTSQDVRGQLNFDHIWNNKHQVTAIIGSEVSSTIASINDYTAYGYDKGTGSSVANIDYSDSFGLLPKGSGMIPNTLGFGKTTDNFLSYYSNAAYTYLGRYVFSLSGRIDKSNLFGVSTNQKAVPLYSAGAGWEMSKEDFYHLNWLPYLKLRATYGYTGNINKSATAVTTISQLSNNYDSGDSYDQIDNPGNPELRWEKDRMINLGLDYAFKNQVLSGSIEYYIKKGIDLFGNSPLPPSTGQTTFFGNTADTKGNGLDIVINSRNISSGNFQWTTNFMISHVIDIVTKYDVTATSANYIAFSNSSSILPLTGKSLFGLYSYAWAGLTHNTGDPQGYLNGKVSTDYAGIIANTSVNDMVYNGSSRPTTFGSFRNTFAYKQLSLSLNIIYKLNYYFRKTSYSSQGLPYSGNQDFYSRWQKPGDETTTNVPSLQYPPYTTDRDLFYKYSSVLIDNGDHIRLQDINLSYDFDRSVYKGLPFKHLQVYGYINNVGILWRANHDGLDPDLSSNTTAAAYPLPRTFSLGIKATL